MSEPINILYLCTGNSCRSQMAEGCTRYFANELCTVQSAGIEAHGQNPRAMAVMSEAGVDISGQQSTVITEGMLSDANVVVTVCGHADEVCPVLPQGIRKIHWPLPDPAKATGSEDEIMAEYRDTRDDIKRRVNSLLRSLCEGADS